MTRTIKASEVKPGMVVRWESRGFTHEGTVERVTSGLSEYRTRFINSPFGMDVLSEATVTVLSEPQPEEPQEFGAKVRVCGGRFVRLDWEDSSSRPWHEKGTGYLWSWDDLCEMGPVTVIPDQGWTVPADIPGVPERIEEWPEDGDEHLRAYKWVDSDECEWRHVGNGEWRFVTRSENLSYPHPRPWDGPWTRVTDA